jgi:Zn-dependent peptidase ImmA (M78 family)
VSVVSIAHELGTVISLRFHTSPGPHFAQIDLGDTPPKIIVYRSGQRNGEREIREGDENLLSPRERFSIAHELGHWVAFSRFRIGPQSERRVYWEHERVMNAFAGCLLAPDWLVMRWLDQVPEGRPVPPFAVRYWASSQCHI